MSETKTPYQRGFEDAQNGKRCPPAPRGDASWADKLYNRGWTNGNMQRTRLGIKEDVT